MKQQKLNYERIYVKHFEQQQEKQSSGYVLRYEGEQITCEKLQPATTESYWQKKKTSRK